MSPDKVLEEQTRELKEKLKDIPKSEWPEIIKVPIPNGNNDRTDKGRCQLL